MERHGAAVVGMVVLVLVGCAVGATVVDVPDGVMIAPDPTVT